VSCVIGAPLAFAELDGAAMTEEDAGALDGAADGIVAGVVTGPSFGAPHEELHATVVSVMAAMT
jgi:hypothetical protein